MATMARTAGPPDPGAHPCPMPSACGPHCSTLHKQKEFAAGAPHQRPASGPGPCGAPAPIKRSTYAFCHGDPGEIGRSRMPMALTRELEDISVGTIIVAHRVGRCRCPREGLGDLSGQPLRRRMSRHLEPQAVAAGRGPAPETRTVAQSSGSEPDRDQWRRSSARGFARMSPKDTSWGCTRTPHPGWSPGLALSPASAGFFMGRFIWWPLLTAVSSEAQKSKIREHSRKGESYGYFRRPRQETEI